MVSRKTTIGALSSALLILLVSASAWAQSFGTISGVVTDPSGAAIPGASITAKSEATGQERTTVSSSTGDYQLVSLPIGL